MRSQTFNLIILSPNRYFVHQPCGFRLESSCVQLDRREGSPVGESQSDHSVWQVPPIMPRHAQVKVESWMILVVTISVQLKITCHFWILIVNTWLVNINYSIGPITESSMIKQCQHELINIHELSMCFMQPLHRDAVTVFIHFYSFFQLSFISASGNAARAKCVFWNVNQVCVCVCAVFSPAPDLRRSSRFLSRVWSRCSASSWNVSWSQNTPLQTAIRISTSSILSSQPSGPSEEPCSRIRWIWCD